jgi:hypothetical protein
MTGVDTPVGASDLSLCSMRSDRSKSALSWLALSWLIAFFHILSRVVGHACDPRPARGLHLVQ